MGIYVPARIIFSVDFCVFLWLNPRQRYSATSLVRLRNSNA